MELARLENRVARLARDCHGKLLLGELDELRLEVLRSWYQVRRILDGLGVAEGPAGLRADSDGGVVKVEALQWH